MKEAPALSVLVLTEDGSSDAHAALVALIKKAFLLVEPACRTHRIRFDPQGETERRYVVANLWKGDGPRRSAGRDRFRLVDLYQAIATRIREEGPPGFVLFHVDGDRRWADRHTGENAAAWESRVREPVRKLLEQHDVEAPDLERAMDRLHRLTPFYSIEAWTYQNLPEARRICGELGGTIALTTQLAAWAADRASLDEIPQIKDVCALGGSHNRRLAESAWPAAEVHALQRSFTAAVMSLGESAELLRALATT